MSDEPLGPDRLKIIANSDLKLEVVRALDTLMLEERLDRISVKRICDVANVSRATFYRYFEDKFSIVQWYLEFLSTKGVDRIGRSLSWYEGYFISTALVHDNIQFFTNASKSTDRNSLIHFAPRFRRETMTRTLVDYRGVEMTEHLNYLVNAVAVLETTLFPAWHTGRIDCSLEEACKWMVECIPHELFELLNTPLEPDKLKRR